mgnify:CR=1 FL=1
MKYYKFGHHYSDWVPMPFGPGNCEMPGFECVYEGKLDVSETCSEDETCPAFVEVTDNATKG